MSLIHEALKKVERQRQLGKAPTLNSPIFERRRKRRWLLPALALAVVLASVCMLWLWRTPALPKATELASAAAAKASTSVAVPVADAPLSTAARRKPNAAKAASEALLPAANRDESADRSAPPPPAADAEPVQEDEWVAVPQPMPGQSATAKRRARQPTPPPAAQAAPAAQIPVGSVPKPAPAPPSKSATRKPIASKVVTPIAAASIAAGIATPTPAQPATPPRAATPARASSAPPMYWDLPYAERRDLPAFQISMHVYAEKPADRFVILNGVRQIEGDELPSGMKLVAIRADGIVIEGEGKRFMVPRDGGY